MLDRCYLYICSLGSIAIIVALEDQRLARGLCVCLISTDPLEIRIDPAKWVVISSAACLQTEDRCRMIAL